LFDFIFISVYVQGGPS